MVYLWITVDQHVSWNRDQLHRLNLGQEIEKGRYKVMVVSPNKFFFKVLQYGRYVQRLRLSECGRGFGWYFAWSVRRLSWRWSWVLWSPRLVSPGLEWAEYSLWSNGDQLT